MSDNLPVADLTRQLMNRTLGRETLPLPFAREIFLLETHVAGIQYYQVNDVIDELAPATALKLRREPCNPHDDLAIEILTQTEVKLGYVPRHRNPVLARLMDAGKKLVAEVAVINPVIPEYLRYTDDSADPRYSFVEIRLRVSLCEW